MASWAPNRRPHRRPRAEAAPAVPPPQKQPWAPLGPWATTAAPPQQQLLPLPLPRRWQSVVVVLAALGDRQLKFSPQTAGGEIFPVHCCRLPCSRSGRRRRQQAPRPCRPAGARYFSARASRLVRRHRQASARPGGSAAPPAAASSLALWRQVARQVPKTARRMPKSPDGGGWRRRTTTFWPLSLCVGAPVFGHSLHRRHRAQTHTGQSSDIARALPSAVARRHRGRRRGRRPPITVHANARARRP